MNVNNQQDTSKTHYFSSPAEAIQIITELLEKTNFKILAKYYDLSNSEIKLSELESGDFLLEKSALSLLTLQDSGVINILSRPDLHLTEFKPQPKMQFM